MPNEWIGVRFPARILTPAEVSLLTPLCNNCSLPGLIVELQVPLTDETTTQSLVNFANDQLKFYCAYHSPIAVPAELTEQTDFACYEKLLVEVYCAQRAHKKYITTCITHQPRCLKRCELIRNIVGDVSFTHLQQLVERGRAIELRRKTEKANAHDKEEP